MTSAGGLVVGTAGHIDHGKTALVRALTGIDTDRLAEEKRRGISIDLGFAHCDLPNGRRVSFIDVPGHERFIRNMLAGVGGIEAVLLIVAADESIKPQTREHFDICRLLGIERGIIVLTKTDIAGSEQIASAISDVRNLCAGSFLGAAPIVPVSVIAGEGLDRLRTELSLLAEQISPRDSGGLARLPIDRSFALKGFGTVVTGTLWSGRLQPGDKVRLHPSKREARVRGLQVHGDQVGIAVAGQRAAVNLSGIDSSEIRRGFVLSHCEEIEPSKLMDVSLEWLTQSDMPTGREQFTLHIGTADMRVAVKVLKETDSGTLARMWLSESFLAFPRDRFVLRSLSPPRTVAGGTIIDAFPPKRLRRGKTISRLESLQYADPEKRIQILIEESADGCGLPDLMRSTGIRLDEVKSRVAKNPQLAFSEGAQRVVSKAWIEERRRRLLEWLRDFHKKNPSAAGAPVSLARMGLEPSVAALIFDHLPAVRLQGDTVSLGTHRAQLSGAENRIISQIEGVFRRAALQPPTLNEALLSAGTDVKKGRAFLEALIKSQRLVRVSEDLVFHVDAISQVRKSLSERKGRRFSVPEFKEWTQISRKYDIPLLEYLDRQHVTRRDGDFRVVL